MAYHQPLVDPTTDGRPDDGGRHGEVFGQIQGEAEQRHVVVERDTALLDRRLPACPQVRVLLLAQHRVATLALGQAQDVPPQRHFLMGQAKEPADHLRARAQAQACDRRWRSPAR
jgi:hypothetical protein